METLTTVNIGLADSITELLKHLLYMSAGTGALTILTIALSTKGILDIFLLRKLDIKKPRFLIENEKDILYHSTLLLVVTWAPIVALFMMIVGKAETNFWVMGLLIVAAFIGYKLIGRKVRTLIKSDGNLMANSMVAIIQVLGKNLAAVIQSSLINIINLILEVVHKLFIYNYMITSIIINAILSVAVVYVMGSSGEAGKLNLIGSLVGAIMHAISVRNKLPKLRKAIEDEEAEKTRIEQEYKEHKNEQKQSNNKINNNTIIHNSISANK